MMIRIDFADGLTKIHDLQPVGDGFGNHYFQMAIDVYHPGRKQIVNVAIKTAAFRSFIAEGRAPIYRECLQANK